MPLEKAPANPVPPTYVPPGGTPYKVKDRDSWATVAASCGVSPLKLVEFNFGTREPQEINWYLHYRVGCNAVTRDHHNYMFSAAASPGVIYLPPTATGSPVPPSPTPAPTTTRVPKLTDYGSVGIQIKGEDDYTARVRAVLYFIDQSDTGDALLQAIGRTGKKIVIQAWDDSENACKKGSPNAFASPDDLQAAIPEGEASYKNNDGKQKRDMRYDLVTDDSILRSLLGLPQEPMIGTGTGSDATVEFTPTMWGYGNICGTPAPQAGSSPSQVLFHELAHAYRMMRGHFYNFPTTGSRRMYDNEEEFFAVVLTNVMISDPTYNTGNRTLRSDHWGFTPLPAAQTTSAGFLAQRPNRNTLEKQAREEAQLVRDLKGVRATFNPFSSF